LSRCQRFDLRRIPAEVLAAHFGAVSTAEGVEVEPEALALIARAAEGSARDGLSILDQAIAHGEGGVTAEQVRAMLGLSDRGAIRRLLGLILSGDTQAVLAAVKDQYDLGVEPSALMRGLLENVHGITRAKVGGAEDAAQSAEERAAFGDWASRLSYAAIHRLWQLLLKGLAEVHSAPMPLEAAEMALLRVIHAADLPDPGELARQMANGETAPARPSAAPAREAEQGAMLKAPETFERFADLIDSKGNRILAHELRENYRLVEYGPPNLLLQKKTDNVREVKDVDSFLRTLRDATSAIFGEKWRVALADGDAQPTLREQEMAAEDELKQKVLDMPAVKAAFEAFPDAELAAWTLDERRSG
ncbi:MAG TPA: DNA polymerase III subunit gamma/tau, partial [Allosphingosinicella sp.]|nr:DNA polymerase III subunit gamma/tau [Allosphingosinicella sp.]